MAKTNKKKTKSLGIRTFSGLNEKRFKQKAGGGDRVRFEEGKTVAVQFLTEPSKFKEYDQHSFREASGFAYVPCAGDECPLCEDDDEKVSKTSYQFAAVVYNHTAKKIQVLKGGKGLAGKIAMRFKRKPKLFLKRVFDITAMPGASFREYDVDLAEEDPIAASKIRDKMIDLDKWLLDQAQEYYGDDFKVELSSDEDEDSDSDDDDDEDEDDADADEDDDEDEEEDEEEHTPESLNAKKLTELRDIADELEIDHSGMKKKGLVDAILAELSEEDEDEDEEDEDDEEEEPPKKSAKAAKTAKKSGKKK